MRSTAADSRTLRGHAGLATARHLYRGYAASIPGCPGIDLADIARQVDNDEAPRGPEEDQRNDRHVW